jgi:adenosylcobinamide-GDP ribazoletransferase
VSRELRLLLTAAQFLTRLPTPEIPDLDANSLAQSVRYFPLVGLLVGVLNATVWWVSSHWLPASVSVGLMLMFSALLTGALHEDGFTDVCDGFGGGTTRERVLGIMKDSRIGAYGALGLTLMVGLKWTILTALPAVIFPLMVVAAHMASRWCATLLILRLDYVRGDEESKSRPFTGQLTIAAWILSGVIGMAGLALLAEVWIRWSGVPGLLPLGAQALGAGAVGAALGTLLATRYFWRRIGGYTGDCLGAAQQIAELLFLLGGLAAIQRR